MLDCYSCGNVKLLLILLWDVEQLCARGRDKYCIHTSNMTRTNQGSAMGKRESIKRRKLKLKVKAYFVTINSGLLCIFIGNMCGVL